MKYKVGQKSYRIFSANIGIKVDTDSGERLDNFFESVESLSHNKSRLLDIMQQQMLMRLHFRMISVANSSITNTSCVKLIFYIIIIIHFFKKVKKTNIFNEIFNFLIYRIYLMLLHH